MNGCASSATIYPFSVILDKAVFKEGAEIRNVRVEGDLSLDGSLIFDNLALVRSEITGSVFAEEAFVSHLSIVDTHVGGSVSFQESVLFNVARLDGLKVDRDLPIRASVLSHFITQFSKVGGLLDLSHSELSHSEARCA